MAEERRSAVQHGQAPPGPGRPEVLSRAAPGPGLVALGTVVRAHGLKGEVRVRTRGSEPARFDALRGCILWDPDAAERIERPVERVRHQGEQVILKLAGVDGIAAARALVGRLVAVAQGDVPPAPPGRYELWQLEGCRVESEEGVEVGEVTGLARGPAQDLWVVRDGAREHLIPAVPEIVVGVDLAARRVVIRPPEGLLDL